MSKPNLRRAALAYAQALMRHHGITADELQPAPAISAPEAQKPQPSVPASRFEAMVGSLTSAGRAEVPA